MRKNFLAGGLAIVTFLIALVVFGQPPSPPDSPTASPSPTSTSTQVLISTATPTPASTAAVTPTLMPNDAGTVSNPSTLSTPLNGSPSPSATPISVQAAALGASSLGWSEKGSPVFRIDQAVITALQQNPGILTALEEIKRTKGVIIAIRAEALPQIGPSFTWGWTDPNLRENSTLSTFTGLPTPPPTPSPSPSPSLPPLGVGGIKNLRSDI